MNFSSVKDEFKKDDFRFPVDMSLLIALFDSKGDSLRGDLDLSNLEIGDNDPKELLSRESWKGFESCGIERGLY